MSLKHSDIDPKEWKHTRKLEHSDVLTGTWWEFPKMDKTGGHANDFHGRFIPQLPRQFIKRYTKRGEVIMDWFLGSGTTMIEAARFDRKCIGVDLNPAGYESAIEKITYRDRYDYRLVQGDSFAPLTRAEVERVLLNDLCSKWSQLAILHPPYHDIIKFSDDPNDLSNQRSYVEFLRRFAGVAQNAMELLQPGRFLALVIGDIYEDSKVIPLGFYCAEEVRSAGGILKSVVVKNIVGNERGKGNRRGLWDYRALAGGYSVFEHEYIFIFKKGK